MLQFNGKKLLLTGANGGITRSVAKRFYDLGTDMVLTDLNGESLAGFAREIDPFGKRVLTMKVDVTKSAEVDASVQLCKEKFGQLDFVVNGAGLYLDQMIDTMTDAQWHQAIGVNLDGVFYACRASIPLLADGGAIVNIASMAGHRGSYMHTHYATAKGGVLAFSRSLARELAPKIRVNAVSPGLIDTPLIQPLLKKSGPALIDQTPMKRLGKPDEVATTIAFLCSDWASFITGETVHINGGLHIAS
jgi:3-oxoacyl-[acyl-carrier protein] reductase